MVAPQDFDFNKLVWIGGVNQYFSVLCVSGKSPINSIEDIQKMATVDRPFKVACQDVGAVEAITLPYLKLAPPLGKYIAGYSGSADSIIAVVKGDADAVIYPDNVVLPFIQSGDLKAILYEGPVESAVLKAAGITVPFATGANAGLAGLVNTRAVALPPGTPENIRASLEASMMKALASPELQDWSKKTSNLINIIPASDLKAAFQRQIDVYTQYKTVLSQYIK